MIMKDNKKHSWIILNNSRGYRQTDRRLHCQSVDQSDSIMCPSMQSHLFLRVLGIHEEHLRACVCACVQCKSDQIETN